MWKRLSFVLAVLCMTTITGCASIVIVAPKGTQAPAASPVTVPVNIEITKSVYGRSVVVSDGTTTTNVSGFSTAIKPGTQNTEVLTTTVSLAPGSYTLTASGTYNQWTGQATSISDTSAFTVTSTTPPAPTFTLGPAGPLVVRRNGGSADLTATITRTGGFSAPITLSVLNPPTGVTAGTATIGAGLTMAQVALTATAAADYGDRTVTLQAQGGGITRTTPVTLRVFHATGSFAKASFVVTTPPQTATSPNGVVRVKAILGTAAALPSAFAAAYEYASGTGPLGQPIPFNHGQTNMPNSAFGGAGFCAGSTAGFVISGRGMGVVIPASAQFLASVLEFTNPSVVGQANVTAFRTSGTAIYYFEPAVYFNSDCTLALAVGAHPLGPANNMAQVINLKRASVVGSIEFNDPTFTASVVDAGSGQRIQFVSGGQTQNVNLP